MKEMWPDPAHINTNSDKWGNDSWVHVWDQLHTIDRCITIEHPTYNAKADTECENPDLRS